MSPKRPHGNEKFPTKIVHNAFVCLFRGIFKSQRELGFDSAASSSTSSLQTYPFRCEVLHASGNLVGAGQQVFEGELLLRHLGHIKGVVHAWGSPGPQVLPQTAFGGVLHQNIQRAWRIGGGGVEDKQDEGLFLLLFKPGGLGPPWLTQSLDYFGLLQFTIKRGVWERGKGEGIVCS